MALGAGEVLLTRSLRDARSATIASRFLLRFDAMTGGLERDERLPALAAAVDAHVGKPEPAARPAPSPAVALRPRKISVTAVDRLKADPFAFYASAMLRLNPLDPIDAEPGPAWRGTAVHAVLQAWMEQDGLRPDALRARIDTLLAEPGVHPIVRTLWQPRLVEACEWVARQIADDRAEHRREPIKPEIWGSVSIAGIEIGGRADRIDRLDDGTLAIVDYKTGKAPSGKAVANGYAMQLGLLAAIAQRGGFAGIAGQAGAFEYWSLASDGKGGFGKRTSPVGRAGQPPSDQFVALAERNFTEAAQKWLTGDAPFIAKLVPEYAPYTDYDQLMRRDEWYGRED